MKRPILFIESLIIAIVLSCYAHAKAQTIPQRANCVAVQGAAAAAVACAVPVPPAPLLQHLTGVTVMCGKASGATAEASVTITGLGGTTGTPTFYIDESQTLPTFVAEDFTFPIIDNMPSTPISVNMPAVTNGGPCSCLACYITY
jgi:hypothetical protein